MPGGLARARRIRAWPAGMARWLRGRPATGALARARRIRAGFVVLALAVGLAAVVRSRVGNGPGESGIQDADGPSPHPARISVRPATEGIVGATSMAAPPGPVPALPGLSASPPGVLHFGTSESAVPAGAPALQYPREWHEFYFTRAAYSSYGRGGWGRRGQSWAIDYPKADIQFLTVLKRLTNLDAYDDENAVALNDPRIRNFPFLYALEVGYMSMSEPEVEGLRDYLLAGGFLVIDDFWGSQEWAQFEFQMKLVFPEKPIIDLELDHTVFNTFYEIDEILQVPAYGRYFGGQTYERDGYVPFVKGIEDDDGRLMVIINWNTDLGDAWEWAEQPDYPVPYSTFAFQMGVNMIVYAMTH